MLCLMCLVQGTLSPDLTSWTKLYYTQVILPRSIQVLVGCTCGYASFEMLQLTDFKMYITVIFIGHEVIKLFSCSTQFSIKSIMLRNVKMQMAF